MNEKRNPAKKNNNQQLMDVGKLPPQAVELEEAVLGAMMLERDSLNAIIEFLKPQSFYKDSHARIFNAITILYHKSYPVDILTVTQQLKATEELDLVGGAYYITQLTNGVASTANAEFHSRIIQQKFIQRELIRIGTITINNSYNESSDVFDLIEELEKNLTSITGNFRGGISFKSMPKLWNELLEKNNVLLEGLGLNGVPSGFKDIDRVTGGFQKGNSIVIAARPGMGKTALVINMACNMAIRFNKPGVVFSLEMSALELFTRMVSAESNTSNNKLNRKGVPHEEMIQVEEYCNKLIGAPLWIDDTPGLTSLELKSKLRKFKRDHKIEWAAIDYLQLMEGVSNKDNREQIVSSISRSIKSLAKELEIPIIALSQLARATEQRGGQKRPQLSDLRESGAIEQDADVVMFIHRPEYYGIMLNEANVSTVGVAEIIFAKNRNGPMGAEKLTFIDYLTKFEDMNYDSFFVNPTPIKEPGIKNAPLPNKFIESNKLDDDHPF